VNLKLVIPFRDFSGYFCHLGRARQPAPEVAGGELPPSRSRTSQASPTELMDQCRNQSLRFGTQILTETVNKVDFSTTTPFKIFTNSNTIAANSVIMATGAVAKRLDFPGMGTGEGPSGFWNRGISACAVCDGAATAVFLLPKHCTDSTAAVAIFTFASEREFCESDPLQARARADQDQWLPHRACGARDPLLQGLRANPSAQTPSFRRRRHADPRQGRNLDD
jgi:hypothetical protein